MLSKNLILTEVGLIHKGYNIFQSKSRFLIYDVTSLGGRSQGFLTSENVMNEFGFFVKYIKHIVTHSLMTTPNLKETIVCQLLLKFEDV